MRFSFIIILYLLLVMSSQQCYAQYPAFGDTKKPKGNIKSFIERCYDTSSGEKVLVIKREYIYTTEGKLSSWIDYDTIDSTKLQDSIHLIYEEGLLIEESGKKFKTRYLYDERQALIAKKFRSGKLNYLERYIRSKDKLLLETVSYGLDNKLIYRDDFKYDDLNRLIVYKHDVKDSSNRSFRAVYTTDVKGNRYTERVYSLNSYLQYSSKLWHDDANNLLSYWKYNQVGSFEFKKEYKYENDEYGNWIVLINKNKGSSYITTREIKYEGNQLN